MLDTHLRNIKYGTTYCAIEHTRIGKRDSFSILITKVRKGELELKEQLVVDEIDRVFDHLEKKQHVHLVITNDQVLSRRVRSTDQPDHTLLLQAFPNIDLNSFYYEIVKTSEHTFITICRREYIDYLIALYAEKELYVVRWSLGISSLKSLLPFIKDDVVLYTNSFKVSIANGNLISVASYESELDASTLSNEPTIYEVDSVHINKDQLLNLGASFLSYSDTYSLTSNVVEPQKKQIDLFLQHRFFNLGLPIGLGILFCIFLVNFLVYNSYFTRVNELSSITTLNKSQTIFLKTKDSLVKEKIKRYEDVVKSSSSKSSYYFDVLIRDMPKSIILNEFSYQPILRKIRPGKEVIVQDNVLRIKGDTPQSIEISRWISNIESKSFVRNVALTIKPKKGSSTFEIIINLAVE